MHSGRRALLACLAAALLGGCATPQADALLAAGAAHGAAHELAFVPYYAQQSEQCGPASLAMVLSATGAAVQPERLRAELYVPGRGGTLAPELLGAARRHGRLALQLAPRLSALLAELDAGNPVIVLQNLGLAWWPVWHYAVVIGYDLRTGQVVLRSGAQPRVALDLRTFERTWERSGYWAMVATAPPVLPASAGAAALLEAAAALERVDAAAAQAAYQQLVARYPALAGAWMGLGNSAAALGDGEGARRAFSRAAQLQPDSADAWNNLASTLLQLGERAPARAAISRALELGGPHPALYEQTRREIEQAAPGAP